MFYCWNFQNVLNVLLQQLFSQAYLKTNMTTARERYKRGFNDFYHPTLNLSVRVTAVNNKVIEVNCQRFCFLIVYNKQHCKKQICRHYLADNLHIRLCSKLMIRGIIIGWYEHDMYLINACIIRSPYHIWFLMSPSTIFCPNLQNN